MNKSADGERGQMFIPLHPWQHLRTLYGWLGERAREAEGKGSGEGTGPNSK